MLRKGFFAASKLVAAAGGVPVIASSSFSAQSGGTDLSFSEPSGLATGDLIVILAFTDQSNTQGFESDPGAEGFTANLSQDAAYDIHGAVYYKLADGTETWPIEVTHSTADDGIGWCLRITGVDQTTPVNTITPNGDWDWDFGEPIDIGPSGRPGNTVTTTVDDCLVIFAVGTDGSDLLPLTIDTVGSDFTITDQQGQPASSSAGVGAGYGTIELATAGAVPDLVIGGEVNDGMTAAIIAIAPAS